MAAAMNTEVISPRPEIMSTATMVSERKAPNATPDTVPAAEGNRGPARPAAKAERQDAEPECGQGEVEPGEAHGRQGEEGADGHRAQPGGQEGHQPRQAEAGGEMGESRRADGGEGGVAQGHLAAGADQWPERDEQQG